METGYSRDLALHWLARPAGGRLTYEGKEVMPKFLRVGWVEKQHSVGGEHRWRWSYLAVL